MHTHIHAHIHTTLYYYIPRSVFLLLKSCKQLMPRSAVSSRLTSQQTPAACTQHTHIHTSTSTNIHILVKNVHIYTQTHVVLQIIYIFMQIDRSIISGFTCNFFMHCLLYGSAFI